MTLQEYNNSVEQYADNIYRYLLKNIRDEELAKDLVQETYTKLWEKHKQVTASKVKSYLFTTAHRTLIDYIRKNKRVVQMEDSYQNRLSHTNQYTDLKEILDEALLLLNEKQRSVILLRDYEGYSYKEISEILSISEDQVKINIYRGRKFLQNYIKNIETII